MEGCRKKLTLAHNLYTALYLCSLGTKKVNNVCESTGGSFTWRSFQVENGKLN